MAWTAPMTAVANSVFTAAQFNTHVRDNLNETAPAKATVAGRAFISTGANTIAEREWPSATVSTSETTTSTSYTDLTTAGPSVTVTTGSRAVVYFAASMSNSTADAACHVGVDVSGASTIAASDQWDLLLRGPATSRQRAGSFIAYGGSLTGGSNVFTLKYKVSAGTGTFLDRRMFVIAL